LAPLFSFLPTTEDIERWTDVMPAAQFELPRLIQKLILLTAHPSNLHVPTGKGVYQGGWDGQVLSPAATEFVPQGQSFWEISARGDVKSKADQDFENRMGTPETERMASSYVFVTGQRWGGRDDWLRDKRKLNAWKSVEAWDANSLATWLDDSLVTAIWLSELIKGSLSEVQTLVSVWEEWSSQFEPTATPGLVTAGRGRPVEVVRGWIEDGPGYHIFEADAPDEGAAFVAASVMTNDPDAAVLHRSAVVRDMATWRGIAAVANQPMLVVPTFLGPFAGAGDHTVIQPVGPGAIGSGKAFSLPPLRTADAQAALQAMGINPTEALRIVRETSGRLGAIQRRLSASPVAVSWAQAASARILIPAVLVGAWDQSVDGDKAALERLADVPYAQLERGLVALAGEPDPPVQLRGTVWSVIGRREVQQGVQRFELEDDWKRFVEIAVQVVGAPDPAWELPIDERYLAAVRGKVRPHSTHLRDALAQMVAMLGSWREFEYLKGSVSGPDLARVVVGRLLTDANGDPTGARWGALQEQLPALAEAAPQAFLEAVRDGVAGADPVLAKLFAEGQGAFFSRNYMTGVLWGLERLAWSPDHLTAVTVLLAKLCVLDPGGKAGNRPKRTLVEILSTWHPQTSAGREQRMAALDAARAIADNEIWALMPELLPGRFSISTGTDRPAWRSWAPPDDSGAVPTDIEDAIEDVLDRICKDAAGHPDRLVRLVDLYTEVGPGPGHRLLGTLEAADPATFDPAQLEGMHSQLVETAAQHRAYPDADWVMPSQAIEQLERVAQRFAPADEVAQVRWLFEQNPDMQRVAGADYKAFDDLLARARQEAVQRTFANRGWAGLEELARTSGAPWAVGIAVAGLDQTVVERPALDWGQAKEAWQPQALAGYLFGRAKADGWEWAAETIRAHAAIWGSAVTAQGLQAAPQDEAVWSLATDLGPEVEHAFWRGFWGFPRAPQGWAAVRKLVEHGRPLAAIDLASGLSRDKEHFDAEAAYQALDAARNGTESSETAPGNVAWDVQQLLEALDAVGFDEGKLVGLEWAFLDVLDEHSARRPRVLHKALATSPEFFVQVVSVAFRANAERGKSRDLAPGDVARAQRAYELLRGWATRVPGQDDVGNLDEATLLAWIRESRELLAKADRAEIGDTIIGQCLWHAPAGSDGLRPHEAVRRTIEETEGTDLIIGFATEAVNSRGGVWRGEGGTQEREIAAQFAERAEAFAAKWPRTSEAFRSLEREYLRQAKDWDIRSELDDLE
jgi:hypothetical protein